MAEVAQIFDLVLEDGETIQVKYVESDEPSPVEIVHYFVGRVVGMRGAIASADSIEELKTNITEAYYAMKKFNKMFPKT